MTELTEPPADKLDPREAAHAAWVVSKLDDLLWYKRKPRELPQFVRDVILQAMQTLENELET